jgi:hypothetical protein
MVERGSGRSSQGGRRGSHKARRGDKFKVFFLIVRRGFGKSMGLGGATA